MTTALRVACVGAGYFSVFHRDGWRAIPETALVAVADRDFGRAEAAAAPDGALAFADAARMLAETRPDLLDIVAPPEAHRALIGLGIEAGVGAIVCQKPFCATLAEAREATEAAEAARVPLVVHENFRFQPWHRALRAEIEAGRLGRVLNLTFRLRPGDGQGPDAYLARQPYFRTAPRFLIRETGVHFIDLFRALLGEPEAVWADLRRLNPVIAGEDAALVVLRFASGARAVLDANRLLDHSATDARRTMGEAAAEGTEATATLDGEGVLRLRRFGAREVATIPPPPPPPGGATGFGGGCAAAFQAHVVAHLLHGAALETGARAYLRNLEIEAAVYRSAESGRWEATPAA